jgi:hypothetical protein
MRTLLLLSTILAGCAATSPNDLSALRNVQAVVNTYDTDYLSIELDYASVATAADHDCAMLAVDATINGVAFTEPAQGGWIDGRGWGDASGCQKPTFVVRSLPAGPTTFELSDATGDVKVVIPSLTAARRLGFATPTTQFTAGDAIAFTASTAAGDQIEITKISATTPAALAVSLNGTYCGNKMFESALSASFDFIVPDVAASWTNTVCSWVLTKGTPVEADLTLSLDVSPLIATCEGVASCAAYVQTETAITTTFVP